MRLFVPAIAALLAASPAAAQGADTRVDDVSEGSDGFSCRAHALPDLHILHDWRGAERSASLDIAGRDTSTGTQRMRVVFRPDADAPFGTATEVLGFQLALDRVPLRAEAKAAHLRIDGKPDATPLAIDGDRTSLSLAVLERLRGDLASALMKASIVEIDLTDATAAPLGRFSWDVRPLRRAPELLQIINWSCR